MKKITMMEILVFIIAVLFCGCSSEDLNTEQDGKQSYICNEIRYNTINEEVANEAEFWKHYEYDKDEFLGVIESVMGKWKGKYPGGKLYDEFEFEFEISYTEDKTIEEELTVYIPYGEDINDKEKWDMCSVAGMKLRMYLDYSSDIEQLNFHGETPVFLYGAKIEMDIDKPEIKRGYPYFGYDLYDDRQEDGFMYSHEIAFLEGPRVFFDLRKYDNESESTEEKDGVIFDWVEVEIEKLTP